MISDNTNDSDEYLYPEPDTDAAGPSSTPQPSFAVDPTRSLQGNVPGCPDEDGPDEDVRVSGEAVLETGHNEA